MKFSTRISALSRKSVQRIKSMDLFRRPSSKRQNSKNLIKRHSRLIK